MNSFFEFQFYLFSLLAIVSALLFVTRKNPVPAALWLVNVMFALSGLFVMLDAPFIGAIQVLVYAGAIMVVFVFVVMLLNLGEHDVRERRSMGAALAAASVSGVLAAELLYVIRSQPLALDSLQPVDADALAPMANSLFTEHLVAFEVTSLLLLVAVIGAVVLAKRGRVTTEMRS
jgi:NADH-quinone oxidoreductase subunit J